VKAAHAELGHGRDVLQVLSHIKSKLFVPGVFKMITDMKKSCPGCIRLNEKPFAAFEADVPISSRPSSHPSAIDRQTSLDPYWLIKT